MDRKPISKKLRFEVFKRDSFTCQYCGRSAPDVILEIDHINPVADGGDNNILNLVTSCFECNRGKGKKQLSEKDTLKKQQEQLKQLNERREQLKMMLDWKEELDRFGDEQIDLFVEKYSELLGYELTEYGRNCIKKVIDKYGLIETLECLQISYNQYFKQDDKEAREKVFNYISRIACVRKREKENPIEAKRYYLKGIARNRFGYVNENLISEMVKTVYNEKEYERFKEKILSSKNWSKFKESFNEEWGWW